jgi:hypothetical protein
MIKKVVDKLIYNRYSRRILDVLLSPFTLLSCLLLRYLRKHWHYLPVSESIYRATGIFPIQEHYYEPLFDTRRHLRVPLTDDRKLPGIDLNIEEQLALIERFIYTKELSAIPKTKAGVETRRFYFENGYFSYGDAEFYYNTIRHFKPRKIIEIGSGFSTMLALLAIERNKTDSVPHQTTLQCIEPYEFPWLEEAGINVIRKRVEEVQIELFLELEANDILFVDSSHMIRPQGDVLFEVLELLPQLNKGVLIHIHDIFTPRDYPEQWVVKDHRFWNEQYLIEAFLSCNQNFRIIGAVNYLLRHHYLQVADGLLVSNTNRIDPGSFWIVRN